MTRWAFLVLGLAALTACEQNTEPAILYFEAPDSGRVGDTLAFRVVARDPDYDRVTFMFDWGDDSTPRWTPFFQPYDTVVRSWVYADSGVFYPRVKVSDIERHESPWSDSLAVRIR